MGECIITRRGGTDTSDANAVAGEILLNKTAYVNDNKITGTMPNNGAINQSLPVNGTYNIPAGYHNGSGKVTQSLATKASESITPSTTDRTLAANQYLTGVQIIKGDANLLSANILSGKSIFGVAGNVVAGKRYATGTSYTTSRQDLNRVSYTETHMPNSLRYDGVMLNISLPFTPKVFRIKMTTNLFSGVSECIYHVDTSTTRFANYISWLAANTDTVQRYTALGLAGSGVVTPISGTTLSVCTWLTLQNTEANITSVVWEIWE